MIREVDGVLEPPAVLGSDEARLKVLDRIREVTESAETEGDVTFSLKEYGIGGETGSLHEVRFEFSLGDTAAEAVTDELLRAAQHDALDRGKGGGKCRYLVHAFRNGRQVPGRCLFALDVAEREGNEDGTLDELPNDKGLTALAMRHSEIAVKVAVGSAKGQIDSLTKLLKEKDDTIIQLMQQNMQAYKTWQELLDAKMLRDLEMQKFMNDERRKDRVAGMLEQGVPSLINRFLGGGKRILQEGSTPVESLLEAFLGTFTKEQLTRIATSGEVTLEMEQRAALQEMLMTLAEKREIQEKQASGAHGAPNGAAHGGASTQ